MENANHSWAVLTRGRRTSVVYFQKRGKNGADPYRRSVHVRNYGNNGYVESKEDALMIIVRTN